MFKLIKMALNAYANESNFERLTVKDVSKYLN